MADSTATFARAFRASFERSELGFRCPFERSELGISVLNDSVIMPSPRPSASMFSGARIKVFTSSLSSDFDAEPCQAVIKFDGLLMEVYSSLLNSNFGVEQPS